MKTRYNIILLMIPMAILGLADDCAANPVSVFYPSPTAATLRVDPKVNGNDIQILPNYPLDNVVILGELSVDGGRGASLHDLMVAALSEAASKGADFVALVRVDTQANLFLGKMVPAGHGRSMFVAGPLKGSEVGRIASIPNESPGAIRVALGKYAK
jgi:hypothetical protein